MKKAKLDAKYAIKSNFTKWINSDNFKECLQCMFTEFLEDEYDDFSISDEEHNNLHTYAKIDLEIAGASVKVSLVDFSKRDLILDEVRDVAHRFVHDDRKNDEDLPKGSINAAIKSGQVTEQEIMKVFKAAFQLELYQNEKQ